MSERDDAFENDNAMTGGEEQNLGISADLIRGHINTIILRSLYDGDKYGYDIINEIEKKSGGLYTLKQPTLYSALKRLESLNYVSSYYGEFSNGGRRKYFSLTDLGRRFTEQNLSEWEYSRTIIDSLISDGNAHYDFSFITEKQNELTDLKKTLAAREQALEDEKVALNNLKNELQRERSLLSTQSASLSSQKSDFIELREKVETQTAELEEKERTLSEKQGEIDAKELELIEKEQEIGDAKTELELKTAEINELKALLETQQTAFTEQQAAFAEQESELQTAKDDLSSLQQLNTELQTKNAELEAKNTELEEQTALLSSSAINNEELMQAKEDLEAMQAELEDKKSIITSLNTAVTTQENTIRMLKEEYEGKTTEFYNRSLELRAQQAQVDAQREKIESEKLAIDAQTAQNEELLRQLQEKETLLAERENALNELSESMKNSEETNSTALAELEERKRELEEKEAAILVANETREEFYRAQAALQDERNALENERKALEEERSELTNKLETLEVERDTLRADNDALEQEKLALIGEKETLNALQASLQAERAELDKKTYDLTRLESAIEEKERNLQSKETEASASSDEIQRQSEELRTREEELAKNTRKLHEDLAFLEKQSNELSTREAIYNQQQLDFVTRKNAAAAQHVEYLDKIAAYNTQTQLFNDNLKKFEADRNAFLLEREEFDKKLEEFTEEKAKFDEEKAALMATQEKAHDNDTAFKARMQELDEKENILAQRESVLNAQIQEFAASSLPIPPAAPSMEQLYNQTHYPQSHPLNANENDPYKTLRDRAHDDGVVLYTAGNTPYLTQQTHAAAPTTISTTTVRKTGTYNVGATLFKAAMIMLCFVAFESLVVFFLKDYLNIPAYYPAIPFGLGFMVFIVCAILNARGYRTNARRKKHPSYILTTTIIFVISMIIVSMVAVYLKAQISDPKQLLSYVVIPVVYLANMMIFVAFYRMFSTNESANR